MSEASAAMRRRIRQQVAAGMYDNASELIVEALKLLYDPERFAALRAAVEEGFAEPDDEDMPFTDELFEDIRRTARG